MICFYDNGLHGFDGLFYVIKGVANPFNQCNPLLKTIRGSVGLEVVFYFL